MSTADCNLVRATGMTTCALVVGAADGPALGEGMGAEVTGAGVTAPTGGNDGAPVGDKLGVAVGSSVTGAGVTGAGVTGAEVTGAGVTGPGVTGAGVTGAGVTGAGVTGAGVTGEVTGAEVTGAGDTGAGVTGPGVTGAGVTGAGVTGAGVTGEGFPTLGTGGSDGLSLGTEVTAPTGDDTGAEVDFMASTCCIIQVYLALILESITGSTEHCPSLEKEMIPTCTPVSLCMAGPPMSLLSVHTPLLFFLAQKLLLVTWLP